ncbi:thiopurine S-methyltransferase [Halobacteriovorax sp. HLS]|uniref:thiopurine S-methyltransferase n=1 Tax=Halobacteriovorax sp. HLS TaxID=2234000 RepID=UPI000FD8316A|nr:thiopurine S-methyltransferase [Halobacteriovorax sp. HLS]
MDANFWKEAWQDRRIGFHMSEYNGALKWFFEQSYSEASGNVLVPLCGKTLDMIYLQERGFNVYGVEIAEQAVLEFFADNSLEYNKEEGGDFSIYTTKGITIFCGDIFKLKKDQLPQINFIYDRAATVALPPQMRLDYYEALKQLSSEATEIFLVTAHSVKEDLIGPPFSVPKEEIETAYKPVATKFEILHEKSGKINSQRLRDQGVTERIMVAHHIQLK